MGERSVSLGAPEVMGVNALKDTLYAQQELLQKLYTELDVEREASATATSEALSMILKLQGEKAAVEMEGSQYKRIAEEKMVHAEETLSIFRDLIYQKEMQIASLEFQVQAYKFKLLSLGCNDVTAGGVNETSQMQYPENMLSRRTSCSFLPQLGAAAAAGSQTSLRRGCSLPPTFLKDAGEEVSPDVAGGDKSGFSSPKMMDLNAGKRGDSTTGDYPTYWNQIRKLEERVKELSIFKDYTDNDNSEIVHGLARSYSYQSQESASSFYDALRGEFTPRIVEGTGNRDIPLEVEQQQPSVGESTVQDVYEVPEASGSGRLGSTSDDIVLLSTDKKRKNMEGEDNNRSGKPPDWMRRIPFPGMVDTDLRSPAKGGSSEWRTSPFGIAGDNRGNGNLEWRTSPMSYDSENKTLRSRDGNGINVDHQLYFKRPDVTEFEMQQMNRRLKRLEDERMVPRHSIPEEISIERGEEELSLLRAIKGQLDSIQNEIASLRTQNNPSSTKEPPVRCLKEAMLHFWS